MIQTHRRTDTTGRGMIAAGRDVRRRIQRRHVGRRKAIRMIYNTLSRAVLRTPFDLVEFDTAHFIAKGGDT